MITLLSPSKSLDFDSESGISKYTRPVFLKEASAINAHLRTLKPSDLVRLQTISAKLAELNSERNLKWKTPFTLKNAKQAVLAFSGDVYEGMNASDFSEEELDIVQEKIRILSGLYGLLKPLDLIKPYRLEMGTRLQFGPHRDLYHFWQDKVTAAINKELKKSDHLLVNLASREYFKVIDLSTLKGKVITPVFKDKKDGKYMVISFFAKKARGLMCRFMVNNRISDPEDLKAFDLEGYHYNPHLTKGNNWVFTRER